MMGDLQNIHLTKSAQGWNYLEWDGMYNTLF